MARRSGVSTTVVLALALVDPALAQSARKPTAPSGKPMTGTEIQTFVVGVTLESVAPDGSKAEIQHKADGTSTYDLIRGDKRTRINGIWTVRGNQFCRKFDRPKETEVCLDYRRVDDTTVAVYNDRKLVARQRRQ